MTASTFPPHRVVLVDLNPELVAAWRTAFAGIDAVEVQHGSIFDAAPADAIVSPANAFGFMDGGIDLAYVCRWGWGLQDRLRQEIWNFSYAQQRGQSHDLHPPPVKPELPVGYAVVVPTLGQDIPWMIAAPTMRFPGPVPGTQNAYHAFRAALWWARARGFKRVLCPGLGTLTGRIPPVEAARQMRLAWDEIMLGKSAANAIDTSAAAVERSRAALLGWLTGPDSGQNDGLVEASNLLHALHARAEAAEAKALANEDDARAAMSAVITLTAERDAAQAALREAHGALKMAREFGIASVSFHAMQSSVLAEWVDGGMNGAFPIYDSPFVAEYLEGRAARVAPPDPPQRQHDPAKPCREADRAAGRPYGRSSCAACGSILVPGWKCPRGNGGHG